MRIAYLLLVIFFCTTTSCWSQRQDADTISVAFYNCENLFDTQDAPGKMDEEFTPSGRYHYTEAIYRKKLKNIATVVQKMGAPLLVGLAEIENDAVLKDLVKQSEIQRQNYRYIWFDGPDERGIDVALLYKPGYFKVLHARPLRIRLTAVGRDSNTRDVLYVSGILAGDTVHVLVNHWPSRNGGAKETDAERKVAAAANRKMIDSLLHNNSAAKVIVMGDLNDNPTDENVAGILGDLYNPWQAIYRSGKGTLAYKHQWDLFDQIIISRSFINNGKWRYDNAAIFKPDFLIDRYKGNRNGYPYRSFKGPRWIGGYSDHFPVILYLSAEKK